MAYSIDDLRKLYLEGNKSAIAGEKAVINQHYNTQAQAFNDNYAADVAAIEENYDNLFDQNAVQRMINERQVAESMANAGLTKSGMNASQMLATQLSYGNANAATSRQRQAELDTLARALRSNLQTVENKRASDLAGVDSTYSANADKYATDVYNQIAEAEKQQAEDEKDVWSVLGGSGTTAYKNQYLNNYASKYGLSQDEIHSIFGNVSAYDKNNDGVDGAESYTDDDIIKVLESYHSNNEYYDSKTKTSHLEQDPAFYDFLVSKGWVLPDGGLTYEGMEFEDEILRRTEGTRKFWQNPHIDGPLEYTKGEESTTKTKKYKYEIPYESTIRDNYGNTWTLNQVYQASYQALKKEGKITDETKLKKEAEYQTYKVYKEMFE